MKKLVPYFIILVFISCNSENQEKKPKSQSDKEDLSTLFKKIKVLNVGTFHMGGSSDSITVDFDDNNQKNRDDAKKIAEMISKFKPTVICVEREPSKNKDLNQKYKNFFEDPDLNYSGEIGLIAFEVGRANNIKELNGIDHKMNYNYNINQSIENTIDSTTYNKFMQNMFASVPNANPFEKEISLKEKLKRINQPQFLDLMILANAEMLTYVGTDNGFEGADEAAKYYQRNLRIYSNLNRLPLKESDRVFILFGASHTGFLNQFLKRSPKYEVVNTLDYLK